MRITHVVVSSAFAGTERYVSELACRQAERGHDVLVLGGDQRRMRLSLGTARWKPADSIAAAYRTLLGGARRDVVHAHLSFAELAVVLAKPVHRATAVSTRHIAASRGKTRLGRLAHPLIARGLDVEIAISAHVAAALERPPSVVLRHGVASVKTAYDEGSRTVLILQRLEPEKQTATALVAWQRSGLAAQGWQLVVAGEGSERVPLERQSAALGLANVRFLGLVEDVPALLSRTAVLLAPAAGEPLGLSVLEAMAHGVPVVASASGGHGETLPVDWPWTFPVGDATAAGAALRGLSGPVARRAGSKAVRARQASEFDIERHVEAVLAVYSKPAARRGPRA